jgi:hypothetical protein
MPGAIKPIRKPEASYYYKVVIQCQVHDTELDYDEAADDLIYKPIVKPQIFNKRVLAANPERAKARALDLFRKEIVVTLVPGSENVVSCKRIYMDPREAPKVKGKIERAW